MGRSAIQPPRAVEEMLTAWGSAIRTARIRRGWRRPDFAAKTGLSASTMQAVERGAPGVGVGAFLSAMWALGLLNQVTPLTNPASDQTGVLLEAQRKKERVRLPDNIDDDF